MLLRPVNLAIVDDHTLFRNMLKNYLAEQINVNVVLQASDITDLLDKLKGRSADVLLMDIFLPGINGNEALKMIRSEHPGMKILALSMSTDLDLISELLDAGIHGYISKGDEPQELLQAIQALSEGRLYKNTLFTEAMYRNRQNSIKNYNDEGAIVFSERESKILQLMWEEKSNKEIANELFLGVRSVEKIRQDMKEKVGARSTIGLLKYAIRQHIIEINTRKFLTVNHYGRS